MKLNLSKRLKKIVDMCEPCDLIADVGTDHGKVAISVANMNISNEVFAIDNKIEPLTTCEKNAKLYLNANSSKFTTICSNGIESLDRKREVGIIITGIGYDNMYNILLNINEYNYKYLILSPHTKITTLISFLDSINIRVVEQESVFEFDKYYYIIKAKKGGYFES